MIRQLQCAGVKLTSNVTKSHILNDAAEMKILCRQN